MTKPTKQDRPSHAVLSTAGFDATFSVMIEPGVWLATWQGDPGRTYVRGNARKYRTESGAKIALARAQKMRPFKKAKVVSNAQAQGREAISKPL